VAHYELINEIPEKANRYFNLCSLTFELFGKVGITRSLGLDIGDKRIGMALSDPQGILASPFNIINREDERLDIQAITNIISQKQVKQIIVGLPRSMDGSIGEQAEKVKAFT